MEGERQESRRGPCYALWDAAADLDLDPSTTSSKNQQIYIFRAEIFDKFEAKIYKSENNVIT